ncbi:MAG: hypothetical protein AAF716_07235 [Cyanobacteria bacterium P01_D01_bin.1]
MNNLWDMCGADGLEVAQSLFGEEVTYLAPFQSIETGLDGEDCSVLRLCDRNFRIRYPGPLDQRVSLERCVWIKQYEWLGSLLFPIEQLSILVKDATVRAPHRFENLPNHQALPARFRDIPLLIWRHSIQGNPAVELHVAQTDLERLSRQLAMG